jgi:hypothetical protein
MSETEWLLLCVMLFGAAGIVLLIREALRS